MTRRSNARAVPVHSRQRPFAPLRIADDWRSSRCTVDSLANVAKDTGANMVILDLQNYHSSRRRSNVRAVRPSMAPAASRQIFQIMVCMLCMLEGHSRHNIAQQFRDGRRNEGARTLKTHESIWYQYLKELNAIRTTIKFVCLSASYMSA
jgi:hypothetical protein